MFDTPGGGQIVEANSMQSDALAEETHSGRVWSLVILPAVLGPALSVAFYPTHPARIAQSGSAQPRWRGRASGTGFFRMPLRYGRSDSGFAPFRGKTL